MLGAVAAGLFATFIADQQQPTELPLHLLYGIIIFGATFAMLFKEDVLPRVNEHITLSYTLILWYAFLRNYAYDSRIQILGAAAMLAPTGIVIWIAVSEVVLSVFWKIALYTWFLCTVVGLGVLVFPPQRIAMFLPHQTMPWMNRIDAILAGMGFLYLIANATYLYFLVPLPGKSQSWADRMKEWHAFVDILLPRFDATQSRLGLTLLLLLGQGGALLLNYQTHWLPDGFLINSIIVLPGIFTLLRPPPTQPAEGTQRALPRQLRRRLR